MRGLCAFEPEQKNLIVAYLKKYSDIYFGLTPKYIRRFAYTYAVAFNRKIPPSWMDREIAGVDWFSGLMKRDNSLSIRSAQADTIRSFPSLARATSFDKTNFEAFYKNLRVAMNHLKIGPLDIWNVDGTCVTTSYWTERSPPDHQIERITSVEQGRLVTVAIAVNASGNSITPFIVFPRVNYQPHFICDSPVGSEGDANPSRWMHFVHHARCSIERPCLLLLDNHDSHLSVQVLDYCKNNGVTLLSFHPHYSHKLQPLDRSVYGPSKRFINTACDSWMSTNKCTMTIYDIPGILATALPLATMPVNIEAVFRVTGIYPLNVKIFQDADFMPSYVTDRPAPITSNPTPKTSIDTFHFSVLFPSENVASTSTAMLSTLLFLNPLFLVHPPKEDVRPFEKAEPSKDSYQSRKRRQTVILTGTPVRNSLREEQKKRKKYPTSST
ncbi:hypothetical protein J437_LFUL007066 [Ladona fulva]|uniref:DDE-1 domain-containing protein n=1 Tax=Ladona fulva TaxID=123851 RepID=A0A8K0K6P6_LADFU|nr:hypothetical protein J437_LFUL007066 [Ladona fulva]